MVKGMLKVVLVIVGVYGVELVLVLLGVGLNDWVVVVGGYLFCEG